MYEGHDAYSERVGSILSGLRGGDVNVMMMEMKCYGWSGLLPKLKRSKQANPIDNRENIVKGQVDRLGFNA